MHPFFLVGAVLHATLVAVIAFFILFAAGKSGGLVKTLGNLLGVWVLIIAAIILVCGAVAQMSGKPAFGMPMMGGHHGCMHGDWGKPDMAAPAQPATPPAAMAQPAAPKKP